MPIELPALALQPVQQPDILGRYAKIQQIRSMGQEAQLRDQQIQAATQANELQAQKVKDMQTVTKLYMKNHGDIDQTVQDAANAGVTPETLQGLQQHATQMKMQIADLIQKQGANASTQADLMMGAHKAVEDAPLASRPQVYQQQLIGLHRAGVDVSQMPMQYPGDEAFKILGVGVQGYTKQIQQALQEAEAAKNTGQAAQANTEAQLNQAKLAQVQAGGAVPGVSLDVQEANSWLKQHPGKTLADFMKYKATLVPITNINLQAGLLNDQAKQMAAQNYAQTGQLPAGMMRSPAMSAQILNNAASGPGGIPNIAANKATFQANEGSLKALQKNFDQVTAFENTAGKNLDVFLKTAQKVVDSGSPWINRPLRMVAGSGLGSEDQAAFNAARQTAITEIAKVLNSNASGVLSDSARHEVEGLIGPNASLKQIVSAANILKQDMANRHQAYQEQIDSIKGRVGAKSAPAAGAPAQGGAFDWNSMPQHQ